ncbi:MAG: phage antirepressor protein [Candidatus Aenigmarchaeota archaeon]|nr:phage antirepressor protein [Candidatus Aenigmarchaeota archaeon]
MDSEKALVVFEDKKIRRTYHNDEWWFVIADIVEALTDSSNPRQYIKNMRNRDEELSKGWVQIEHPLSIDTVGGKQKVSCANTEGIFRIIQSIPSPKAEPFKRWLAKVGYERVQEIQNPELAQERMKQIYEQKGYSKAWIDKRLRGIAIRQELTDEWKNRDIKEQRDYAILTNEISMATFGKTVDQYKKYKQLKNQNLRDHMNDLELIFTMLGEKVTTEITQNEDADGFHGCRDAAKRGGNVAGKARVDAEKEIGKPVISEENYLGKPESVKRLEKKKE